MKFKANKQLCMIHKYQVNMYCIGITSAIADYLRMQ